MNGRVWSPVLTENRLAITSQHSTGPVALKDRLDSLDVLRGFALLGILVMNIQGFAMVSGAYFDPSLHMDLTGLNWWIWAVSHVFADSKFMALFSLLFGAGIVLTTRRRGEAGKPAWTVFYRRNAWLLVFGQIHAYFIWSGDILVAYAIAGFVVFWMRGLKVLPLTIIGLVFLSIALALSLLGSLTAPLEMANELATSFSMTAAEISAEIEAFQGNWFQIMAERSAQSFDMQVGSIPFYLFWRAGGLMLIGMALLKADILSAKRSDRFYWIMAVAGLVIGLPLVITSATQLDANGWDPLFAQFGVGLLYNYVGSLGMTAAYIAIVMLMVRSGFLQGLQNRLAAVGRMAFNNYIMHSVLCTLIFYGAGLGFFGSVERWGQVLIVLAIWAIQLILSPLWLSRFRFGPLEWLWRSMTYWRIQPFRKAS